MSASSPQQIVGPAQLMTLAALAPTGSTVRPSGETTEQQEQRILAGINTQLANGSLSTANAWQALWVGLTRDRANLAYIAQLVQPSNSPVYAVCLRGTVAGSPIDSTEDMKVGTVFSFAAGGNPSSKISQGAMEAFTEIIMGTSLVEALTGLVKIQQSNSPTIYVTGHSLGGALATTVSLYLAAIGLVKPAQIVPYTFAAPTAGDQNFATWFNKQFPAAQCYYNQYDVVPNAWWNLVSTQGMQTPPTPEAVEYFYPGMPAGPGKVFLKEIENIVTNLAASAGSNIYVQPNLQPALNPNFTLQNPQASTITTIAEWEDEATFQHNNNTYLQLLSGTPLPEVAPAVTSISPANGPASGFTEVTVSGSNFTPDSVVDFGILPGIVLSVAGNGQSLTALAPAGAGLVDVVVTNQLGTSAIVSEDEFTFTPPS